MATTTGLNRPNNHKHSRIIVIIYDRIFDVLFSTDVQIDLFANPRQKQ